MKEDLNPKSLEKYNMRACRYIRYILLVNDITREELCIEMSCDGLCNTYTPDKENLENISAIFVSWNPNAEDIDVSFDELFEFTITNLYSLYELLDFINHLKPDDRLYLHQDNSLVFELSNKTFNTSLNSVNNFTSKNIFRNFISLLGFNKNDIVKCNYRPIRGENIFFCFIDSYDYYPENNSYVVPTTRYFNCCTTILEKYYFKLSDVNLVQLNIGRDTVTIHFKLEKNIKKQPFDHLVLESNFITIYYRNQKSDSMIIHECASEFDAERVYEFFRRLCLKKIEGGVFGLYMKDYTIVEGILGDKEPIWEQGFAVVKWKHTV